MIVRRAAVAGAFYAGLPDYCREQLEQMVPRDVDAAILPGRIVGGLAPHAGWAFSGRVCAAVYAAIAARARPDTFVLFGASHRRLRHIASLYAQGAWQTPLGLAPIDGQLADQVLAGTPLVANDPAPHENEHSIEVQVPFIQHLFPQARILPILVEPTPRAVEVGQAVARAVRTTGAAVVYVGSSDLTHYGPSYGFMPQGAGEPGRRWAWEINDRRLIELMRRMEAPDIVREVAEHRNACGSGAIAATLAACRMAGAGQGVLLSYASSYEVSRQLRRDPGEDAVSYAGMVFG